MNRIRYLLCVFVGASSLVFAEENPALQKKLKELKDADPKVRAAALRELAPVYIEVVSTMMLDQAPEVAAVKAEVQRIFSERMLKAEKTSPEFARARLTAQETAATASCKAFAEAQDIYRRTDYNRDGVLEYAQKLRGNDSLYETKAGEGDVGLIDKTFAAAGDGPAGGAPKAGYYFKILTAQGKDAVGGAKSYIANGHMTFGYAIIAYPAEYGKSGKNCFMINQTGVVYQKDLGPDTTDIISKLTEFNADKSWVVSE